MLADFGPCDVLINGAGGNNPRATTDNEFHYEAKDIENCKTFFDLEKSGVEFVFSLNWLGTLLPTQVFAADMIDRNGNILNIASMNAYTPLTKIPAYSGAKSAIVNFTQWLATYFAKSGIRVNAIAPGFFVGNQNRGLLFNEDGTPTRAHGQDPRRHPDGPLRRAGRAGRRCAVPGQQRCGQLHHRRLHPDRRRLRGIFGRIIPDFR